MQFQNMLPVKHCLYDTPFGGSFFLLITVHITVSTAYVTLHSPSPSYVFLYFSAQGFFMLNTRAPACMALATRKDANTTHVPYIPMPAFLVA